MIRLSPCPKAYSTDQDKAVSPEQTLASVRTRLQSLPLSILARTTRIDNGRLGIPVFLSVCGEDAKSIMPTRKQMGKGASAAQAEASALMELMERYGFFTYWQNPPGAFHAPWGEAEARLGPALMPLAEVTAACHDSLPDSQARRIMNLRSWLFAPAARLVVRDGRLEAESRYVPLDLFRQLGEFNGSSAGNTDVESLLQGACELVERHVCCRAERELPELPTIDGSPGASGDPVLESLLQRFRDAGIEVLLKDFSMGMPVPTVAALAYDPSTFPDRSEIVFTAGTAAGPAKAAIRALTEVAQLAGDFNSRACYEASGLPKYESPQEADWLRRGPVVPLHSLPSVEADDILEELRLLVLGLERLGFPLYAVSTRNADTDVPTHYSFAPGLMFRERDKNASLGLFAGRMISEETESGAPSRAPDALDALEDICPGAHYLPFFRGMAALRQGLAEQAAECFAASEALQPDDEAKALAAFYQGYALSLDGKWQEALPALERAARLSPDMKGFLNHLGVCLFKLGRYEEAAQNFGRVISHLDKGSAVDLQNLGLCRKFQGRNEEARHYLAAALELDPSLEAAAKHLAELGLPTA